MSSGPSARLHAAAFEYENLLLKAGALVRPESSDEASIRHDGQNAYGSGQSEYYSPGLINKSQSYNV